MILNISSRTDILAFYSKWFIKRLEAGYVDVRNPFNEKLVSRIYFKDVEAIMFCTKNPLPILDYLPKIKKPIVFHVTITPYKKDIEPNVPPKGLIIEGVKKLSKILGKENVVVRYDPIFISDKYNIEYHKKAFNNLCMLLNGYIDKIIVSFIDDYKNVRKNNNVLRIKPFTEDIYKEIGLNFSKSAKENNITVQTCAEKRDLTEYGFIKGECLSKTLAYQLTGKTKFKKWQERDCECVQMVDIGAYNTCLHLCKYCYANFDETKVKENKRKHDVNASMLIGHLSDEDIVKIRTK